MKVAYLLGSLNRGGMEVLLLDTLNHIEGSDIEAICVFRNEGLLSDEFMSSGVKMISLRPKTKFDLAYLIKLRTTFTRNRISIVHAQQPLEALYAYLACLGLNIKIALTIHGYDFNSPKRLKRILKFIWKRIAINIFVSKTQQQYYLEKYKLNKTKTRVVYNGVSFNKLNSFKKTPIRQEFNIPESKLLLGSVGNFTHARDQLTICRFLNLLNSKDIGFSFIFAGSRSKTDPHYWDDCIEYCAENNLSKIVHFPGSRKDVPNILRQLDAFIYSTEHDTFGIAIIEAIYAGLPVFVNDWEVISEITENGSRAIMYQTKNEHDLLEKFLDFIDRKDFFVEKAKQDAKWAENKYSIQNYIANISEVYKEIMKSKL